MFFSINANQLIIENDGKSLNFNLKYYLRSNSVTKISSCTTDTFKQINNYISKSLKKSKRDKLFQIYSNIFNLFYIDGNELRYHEDEITVIIEKLQCEVCNLYKEIDFDHLRRWCLNNPEFYIQPGLQMNFEANQKYKLETTYLVNDYIGLLFLTTLLKFIAPIWGNFISVYAKNIGKDHKELVALTLLNKTNILILPEYEKIQQLIVSYSEKINNTTLNAVFGNLGSVDLSEWVLAIVIMKVAVARVDEPEIKLINVIYSQIKHLQNLRSLEDRGEGVKLKERKNPEDDDSGDEENKTSVLEKLKLRQDRADNVSVLDSVYLTKINRLIKTIDSSLPISKGVYAKCLTNVNINLFLENQEKLDIRDFHIQICGVICRKSINSDKRIISPTNLISLNHSDMLIIILASQLILHHWGFNDLSTLLTAKFISAPADVIRYQPNVLPIDLQKKLEDLYPYFKNNTKTSALQRKPLICNYGTIFINQVVEFFYQHDWYHSHNLLMDDVVEGTPVNISPDIKVELAKLLLKTMNS